jgi:pyruvate dehydrogenase E1 component alpha subunit
MSSGPHDISLRLYRVMSTIKQCDERFRSEVASGKIFIVYYSPRGQEAISAAIGCAVENSDYLVTTYRGLHDHIAKGVPLRSLCAEFLGRATGTCKGKGGPMHVTDPASGVMVTTGIVGAGLPIATGLALSAQLSGDGRVTVVTFGDGASNIGAFHEAMNLAALWNLPMVFVCQNNRYAEMTPFAKHQRNERVSDRAQGYAMRGVTVDGNDPLEVYAEIDAAVRRARAGEGPTLVEALTYRFWGHYLGDAMTYMPEEERAEAMAADPVPQFRSWIVRQGIASEDRLSVIEAEIAAEVDDAFEYAHASPPPGIEEAFTDVYAEGVPA